MKLLGMITREYFTDFRRRHSTAGINAMMLVWMTYYLLGLPGLLGYLDSAKNTGIYLAAAIPFGLIIFDAYLWQIGLPKLMFLCPLDENLRRSYVRGACRFRVAFHTAIGVLGALISLYLGNDGIGAAALAVNAFLFSIIGIGINDSGTGADGNGSADEQYMRYFRRMAVRGIGAGLALILQIIYADVARGGGMMRQAGWERGLIGCLMALLVLFTIRYWLYWRPMQEAAIHYERTGQRAGEWKSQKKEG